MLVLQCRVYHICLWLDVEILTSCNEIFLFLQIQDFSRPGIYLPGDVVGTALVCTSTQYSQTTKFH